MPSCRLAVATEDVGSVIKFSLDSGLKVRNDKAVSTPEPDFVNYGQLNALQGGVFVLYKEEWVYGPAQYGLIDRGRSAGKYLQSPRVNTSPIMLYFGEERVVDGVRRLGSGVISWDRSWLKKPDKIIHETPKDVEIFYKKIINHIDIKRRLRGGGQTYMVLETAWRKLSDGLAIPPFDYIIWPPHGGK